jgi:hypothetical protein
MTVVDLIKVLADVCRYNVGGKVCLHINGKVIPLHHCIDDYEDVGEHNERVVTLVAEGDDYYGT